MGCRQSKAVPAVPILHVIVVHYNPCGFQRRAILVNECLSRLFLTQQYLEQRHASVRLQIHVMELLYGQDATSELHISSASGMELLQRRVGDSKQVLWSKEQLINIVLQESILPLYDASTSNGYVAWLDSDIEFRELIAEDQASWVSRTIATLQQHPLCFGQVWTTCDLLGPPVDHHGNKLTPTKLLTVKSFAYQYTSGKQYTSLSNRQKDYWHPGFAWIATTRALQKTNGLIDRTLGSADRHMAMSFLGRAKESVPQAYIDACQSSSSDSSCSYLQQVLAWERIVQQEGIEFVVVDGVSICHHWHGSLRNRRYMGRWEILRRHCFCPEKHLQVSSDGILCTWNLETCPPELLDDVKRYFEERDEDCMVLTEEDYLMDAGDVGSFEEGNTVVRDKKVKKRNQDGIAAGENAEGNKIASAVLEDCSSSSDDSACQDPGIIDGDKNDGDGIGDSNEGPGASALAAAVFVSDVVSEAVAVSTEGSGPLSFYG